MGEPLRFEIRPDSRGGCHVRLTDARNHDDVYWTGNFRDLHSARRAISHIQRNIESAPVVDNFTPMRRLLRLPLAS
jgi:uncharacterized protein YegP (UPF0339 family)